MALVPGQNYTPEQIYAEDPDWLKQYDPNLYSHFTSQVSQPESSLQGSQLSNIKSATELPAVKAQSAAATTDIPLTPTPSSAPLPQIDSPNIRDTYRKTWEDAPNLTQRDAIANSFKSATGQNLFNLYLSPGTTDAVNTLLGGKQQINIIKDGLANDPKLKTYMGNPFWSKVIDGVMNLPGGPSMVQNGLGLNDKGMAALSGFTKLQGLGDRTSVGGRLSGYMVDFFNKAQPGLDRNLSDNLNQLNLANDQTNKYLDFYAKQEGFKDWSSVPGATSFQTTTPQPQTWNDITTKKY